MSVRKTKRRHIGYTRNNPLEKLKQKQNPVLK